MNDRRSDIDDWARLACDVMTSKWQIGLVDLAMSESGMNMPDVKLEALCDIIFADLTLRTQVST